MATLKNTSINDKGFIEIPSGTTAERPSVPVQGMIRYNETFGFVEYYNGTDWINPITGIKTGLITDGLILHLDAADTASYPGTGTVWTDLSGAGNNFNIVASAYNPAGYMMFTGSHGCAKNASNISLSGEVTYCAITRIIDSTATWRTLTRGYGGALGDHHAIVENGTYNIGIFDNDDSIGFLSAGYSQQALPGYASNSFDFMTWRWSNMDAPSYQLDVEGSTRRGAISGLGARYSSGFGSLGAHNSDSTDPSVATQYWGDISLFLVYNRRLTDVEVKHNYMLYANRFA